MNYQEWIKKSPAGLIIKDKVLSFLEEGQEIPELGRNKLYFLNEKVTSDWKNLLGDEMVAGCFEEWTKEWENLPQKWEENKSYIFLDRRCIQNYPSLKSYVNRQGGYQFEGLIILANHKIIEIKIPCEDDPEVAVKLSPFW